MNQTQFERYERLYGKGVDIAKLLTWAHLSSALAYIALAKSGSDLAAEVFQLNLMLLGLSILNFTVFSLAFQIILTNVIKIHNKE